MVAGAGCLLGAWVAARPGSVRLSTRCITIPKATYVVFFGRLLAFRRRRALGALGGRLPGEGGTGQVGGHAGDCTLEGRSVPAMRRRARLERGLGRAESGGDICDVPAGRFQ